MVTDYEAIVAVKHKGSKGDNIHYHLVVKTHVKDQAFRVRLRKVFNQGKGNEHMSIKPWDGNIDAISYLFHEEGDETPMLEQYNVSDETIAKAKARNNEVRAQVSKAKERASWRLEDEVMAKVTDQYTEDDIARELIRTALNNNKYIPNDFLLRAMTQRIRFRMLDGDVDAEDAFIGHIIQRVFHKYDN